MAVYKNPNRYYIFEAPEKNNIVYPQYVFNIKGAHQVALRSFYQGCRNLPQSQEPAETAIPYLDHTSPRSRCFENPQDNNFSEQAPKQ